MKKIEKFEEAAKKKKKKESKYLYREPCNCTLSFILLRGDKLLWQADFIDIVQFNV